MCLVSSWLCLSLHFSWRKFASSPLPPALLNSNELYGFLLKDLNFSLRSGFVFSHLFFFFFFFGQLWMLPVFSMGSFFFFCFFFWWGGERGWLFVCGRNVLCCVYSWVAAFAFVLGWIPRIWCITIGHTCWWSKMNFSIVSSRTDDHIPSFTVIITLWMVLLWSSLLKK